VRLTRRAAAEIREAAAWWAANRAAAPGAVQEELRRALALISAQPRVGATARNAALKGIRRVHLSRVHYHLYYRIKSGRVEILAFWHASRGREPKV
jgi:plasmid stabilization system protein ParE